MREGDIPVKTRPPEVSTVIDFPETVIPKVAKAGETNITRVTNVIHSNIVDH